MRRDQKKKIIIAEIILVLLAILLLVGYETKKERVIAERESKISAIHEKHELAVGYFDAKQYVTAIRKFDEILNYSDQSFITTYCKQDYDEAKALRAYATIEQNMNNYTIEEMWVELGQIPKDYKGTYQKEIESLRIRLDTLQYFASKTMYTNATECGMPECDRLVLTTNTRFCEMHAREIWRTLRFKICAYEGCYAKVVKNGEYCYHHCCKFGNCTEKAIDRYCKEHLSIKRITAKENKTESKKSTSSSSSYKSSKSKRKTSTVEEMPDCDDYDTYEEFMDDWDGCMPDGSDAEDYWEDW